MDFGGTEVEMRLTSLLFLLAAGILLGLPQAIGAATLTIPGTGACETVLKSVAAAYETTHPGMRVVIPPSIHSGGGIRQVIDGKADLARVARGLTPEEAGKGLTARVFAKDAVVFAVGTGVQARNLTIRQIADIFSGKIGKWEQLGDGKGPIRVLVREPGDSSLQVIQAKFPEFRDLRITEHGKITYHDWEMLEMLQKYRNAIGFTSLSGLNAAISLVTPVGIDGIGPTRENVNAGRYPLVIEYTLVYRDGDLPSEARDFVDFLFSGAGGKMLIEHGLIPVAR
jgi:phosphate transport system substrate-binding protein